MKELIFLCSLALPGTVAAQDLIPPGTILPVQLSQSLSSDKSRPGQVITGRVAQNVPLPGGKKIRARTKVVGHIIRVAPATGGRGVAVSLRFDTLIVSKSSIPITVSLRALASVMELEDAEIPPMGPDRGISAASYTTTQVGGDVVYQGGGPVMNGGEVVGQPVPDGVLVRVREKPGTKCRAAVDGSESPQALWLFSSDACGIYGYSHLTITHAGRTSPVGEIVLASDGRRWTVRDGSGLLLRVIGNRR